LRLPPRNEDNRFSPTHLGEFLSYSGVSRDSVCLCWGQHKAKQSGKRWALGRFWATRSEHCFRASKGIDRTQRSHYYGVMRYVVSRPDAAESKPLTEPVLLILMSLADRPRHGYALLKDIEALSDGRVRLSTGTLYGALRRLLDDIWIERFEQQDTSREKQAYRLTETGRRQLQSELERMKQLTRAAATRLRPREA
jgi:DNA-binding PadR family transcriptional regulator